jgi:hypothetical protein
MAKGTTFAQQVNLAVNQTLSRTVLTVATVAMSAAALFFFGGASLCGPGRLAHRHIVDRVCRGAHRGRRPGRARHAAVTRSEVG